ncbi:hypothetical protein A2997_00505 [Candidatus Nomurabacteria bacterium RIFCSPLOWO2_01_FULL_36_10b]|uniref:Steroid 5-alpha reductase C-terminal domain-containing protein n=1 Tax=Candidatus Nomurabacteria bacterium RIFCSPLOWO2_01_FULL_36_10b TaxID=1801766 RepID=A0A1F6WPW3_9BACT|nr:MAG: hypothetical protein A2997_00505 [Candidatus Nomurabacteria bacterium RIFCSPLOWO2_01_FULL_36_10b]
MIKYRIAQHVAFSPLLILFFTLLGIIFHFIIPITLTTHTLRAIVAGFIFIAIGQAIFWYSNKYRALAYCKDGVCLQPVGSGPYRYSRHPKYGAYLFMIMGLGVIMNSLILVLVVCATFIFLTLFIIPHLEGLLIREFGDTYIEYKKKVPMWI